VNFKLIDNFLEKEVYQKISDYLTSQDIPWFFRNIDVTGDENGSTKNKNGFYNFCFYNEFKPDHPSFYEFMPPILDKLKVRALIQIRANLTFRDIDTKESAFHSDYEYNNSTTGILYLSTCNAKTILKIKDEEIAVDSVENRMLLFPTNILHKAVYQDDLHKRYVINFNFFGEPWL
tara:strand:- start:98 stop:625 length:528 start_codon:yes stop_codon:yes gene_type:complete